MCYPVVAVLFILHSFHKFTQHFISCFVSCGILCGLAVCISSLLFGRAKHVGVCAVDEVRWEGLTDGACAREDSYI